MSTSRIAWTRYVVPRGTPIHFDAEGFTRDPETLPALQPDALTLDAMLGTQCLVLLGEPGLGKSDTLEQAYERTCATIPASERLYLDGRDQFDPKTDLFDTPQFTRWRDEGLPLHLFIDSVDEGPSDLIPRLLSKLRNDRPRQAMHLRLACRTGELPEQLDRELPSLWPERATFFELIPLTPEAIELSAGPRAADFLESVRRRGIASLASRPVTLEFLLGLFHAHEDLPDTRAELYERGCRFLCEESSATRSDRDRHGKLDPDRRLDIASQIAAVCTIARRSLVQRAHDRGQLANDAIRWRDLRTPADLDGQRPAVGDDELREVLRQTALFRSQGPLYLGFAHASYTAFLAARFLKDHHIRLADLVARCTAQAHPGPLPAAVRDLAGWLAHDDANAWQWLLEHDPRVLVVSDLRGTCPADRADLVDVLLAHASEQRLPLHDLEAHYRHLVHAGLADQLRPWILDGERHFLARELAVLIAGACACRALQRELVALVLDTHEPASRLRSGALYALSRIDVPDTLRALLPLLVDPSSSAPDPWSRGRLMRLLWPNHLSRAELFTILDAAVARNDDELSYFIEHRLVPAASIDLLVELFAWLRALPRGTSRHRTATVVREHLLGRALGALDHPELRSALAAYLVGCTRSHEDPFWHMVQHRHQSYLELSERSTRRTIVAAIVEAATDHLRYDRLESWKLLDAEDLGWLLDRYRAEPPCRARWIDLLAGAVEDPLPSGETADRLADTAERDKKLRTALWRWLGPVALDSPEAGAMREAHGRREEWAAESHRRDADHERHLEWESGQLPRLIAAIDAATTDESSLRELFHHIQYYGGDDGGYRLPIDLLSTLAWTALPEPSRDRLRTLALAVLRTVPLPQESHLFPSRYHTPYLVHYSFLRLVHAQSPDWLAAQPVERWEVWSPAIVFNNHDLDDAVHSKLLQSAYRCAPRVVTWCFALLLDRASEAQHFAIAFACIKQALGVNAVDFVAAKVHDDAYPAEPYGALLECMLDSPRTGEAEAILDRLLVGPLDRPEPRARARIAAEILWRHASDFAWPRLAPIFIAHPDFAVEVLHRAIARCFHLQGQLWDSKDEATLVEVYTWLAERFPESQDPPFTGRRRDDDARYRLGELRNSLRHNLQARGTPSSLAALERLQPLLPGEASLTWSCGYARDAVANETWRPLAPDQILRLNPRRSEPARHLFDIFLDHFTIAEMRAFADACSPPFAKELPAGTASAATVAYELGVALSEREAPADTHARLHRLRPELADELARLATVTPLPLQEHVLRVGADLDRLASERREDERLTGFALARLANFSLLHAQPGKRRAYKLLAGLTLLAVLAWLVGVVLG